ncbi:DUF317 domain-containing protein [Streptomyces sp. RFCAC02]|uniref:DUF317 domain-containing protein n=1 Tax=Streptomyces sp. RFCAC02 TaxID=2499143 RepID=UPI00101FB65B|nr:DUF317 domain-containing protein [Streptomyces sp. RFCAC02]
MSTSTFLHESQEGEAPHLSSGTTTKVDTLGRRHWSIDPGDPALVTDQFTSEDFALVVDDRADTHISSRYGRCYLGWFPAGRCGGGEGWVLAVTGTASQPGWKATFAPSTPAEIVAAAVAAALNTSRPREGQPQ